MTPAPKTFRLAVSGGVATLTLDRPASLNSLTFETYRELRDTFRALPSEDAVRAVVVTGAGKGFCSGGNVVEIIGKLVAMSGPELLDFTRLSGDTILAIRQCRKPVVAAVNGTAVGAGAVIALAADIRLASPAARFGFLFPRVGLSGADMGASWLLPRVVGLGRASELLFTGDMVDATAAERIGLVNRIVEPDRLLPEAQALAARLGAGPTFAHAMTKEMIDREAHMDLPTAIEAEAQAQQICMRTDDFREAYHAFVEKRDPKFRGR